MNIRSHVASIGYNAAGTIIATIILGSSAVLLACVKTARDAVFLAAVVPIPVWLGGAVLLAVSVPLLIHCNRLHKRLAEANDHLKDLEAKLTEQAAAHEAQLQARDVDRETRAAANLQHVVHRQQEGTRFNPRRL